MWFLKKKKKEVTITIGSEIDDMLIKRLKRVLDNHNAVLLRHDNYIVGSQDISIFDYKIGPENIAITVETYVGVSLTGEVTIINEILNDLNNLLPNEEC